MAIGAGAAGAWAATNATTHTVTLPAHAAGDLLVVIAACKAATITSVSQAITTGDGWTKAAEFADGTTAAGTGVGSVNQAIFYKIATSGAETNPVITWGGSQTAAPGIAVGLGFTKGASEVWLAPAAVQAATTNATSISVTMGSNPGITAGDWGVIAHTTRDDSALTVPTWSATSATLGTVAVYPATPIASGTSNDMAGTSAYRVVSSGTASAAPVVTGTQAAAETGVTAFIRLRVFTPATTFYPHTSQTDALSTGTNNPRLNGTASGWTPRRMLTTRGSGVSTTSASTVSGPTAGVEIGGPDVYYSLPLNADVTIAGPVAFNIWAYETNATANAAINGVLDVIDGATGTITEIVRTANTAELALTTASVNRFAATPASGVACKRGDRLRVRIYADDAGTMASGFSVGVDLNGTSADADGDTWLGLSESVTVISEPAGTTIYPTDTASAVSTASVDREAWTSRGAGVQTDVTNTATGWAAPIQITDTAGGTVVDWFTRPLAAFTLGGAVRCNVRSFTSSTSSNAANAIEIARVEADGSGATVWGVASPVGTVFSSEFARSFLVSGDDLAISDGQRLRLRMLIDDATGLAMVSGHTVTLYYAGTSGGASGDTYLTFTQTLTEFTSGTQASAQVATGTAAAIGSTDAIVATLAVATTTGQANNPTARPGIATITDAAAATGTALAATAKVTANLGTATATGAAHNASVSTAVSVTAGTAAATASAGPAAVGTSPYSTLIVQDGPAGYWRLGEASGHPQDTSGHGNHVTTTGGTPTYSVTGSLAADPNTAITLDGSTEYFSVPQAASLHGNTISIEAWFKRSGVTGITAFIWDNGYGDAELYISSGDVIFFGRAGVATLRQSSGTYTDTDWHHLVAVKDGATSREIYVDGVAVGTGGTDSTLANANGVSGIGAQQAWNNHWNGSLDEVAVYAYALTAGQVLAHYTAGVPAAATSANAEVATATGAALDADAAPGEYVNPDVAAATGTALGTTTSIAATVGAAAGTGAAYDATASTASMVSATAQVATATGAAVAAAPSIAPDLDAATATGTAITATAHETQPANLQAAAGTGEALGTDAKVGATSVVAAATGAALSPDAALKVNAGVATGTGAAQVADGLPGTRGLANVATATGAALVADGLPGELAPAEVAATAGAAQNGTTKIAPTLQAAAATGAANNATVSVASTGQVTGQTALATGTALNATAKVVANLNVATATGVAANPSVSTSLARTPGAATGTGAAANVTAKVVVNAATAAATGTAANATVTTTAAASATAQVATAQGAAHAATVGAASTISATAAAATGTGTAYNATIIVAVAAAAASSTGTAAAASIAVAVAAHAQTATATGTAYDAGVALGAVAALAEVAVATGIAYNARAQTAIGSGIDTAGGIHGGIVSLPAIRAGVATVPGVRGGIAVEPGVRGGIVSEPRIKGRVA